MKKIKLIFSILFFILLINAVVFAATKTVSSGFIEKIIGKELFTQLNTNEQGNVYIMYCKQNNNYIFSYTRSTKNVPMTTLQGKFNNENKVTGGLPSTEIKKFKDKTTFYLYEMLSVTVQTGVANINNITFNNGDNAVSTNTSNNTKATQYIAQTKFNNINYSGESQTSAKDAEQKMINKIFGIIGSSYYKKQNEYEIKISGSQDQGNQHIVTYTITYVNTLSNMDILKNNTGTNVITNGWQSDDSGQHYFLNGVKQTQKWVKSDGKWYWFNRSGNLVVDSWIKRDGTDYVSTNSGYSYNYPYYVGLDGAMLANTQKTINGKTYKFNSQGEAALVNQSISQNNNSSNINTNVSIISHGNWKGSEGSYWFDQGNGQYPSGNKWFYITTNGGYSGWENYYYWFDNEGYWRPQWYAKDNPANYQTWGSSATSNSKNTTNSQNSNVIINSNKIQTNNDVGNNVNNNNGSSTQNQYQQYTNTQSISQEQFNNLDNKFRFSSESLKQIENNRSNYAYNNNNQQTYTDTSTINNNQQQQQSNNSNNIDTSNIDEYMNGIYFSNTDDIYDASATLTYNDWQSFEGYNIEEQGSYEGYGIKKKISGQSKKGCWIPCDSSNTQWMFIIKTAQAKKYNETKEDYSNWSNVYYIEEYLEEGVYLIGSNGNYKLYEFSNGITNSTGLNNNVTFNKQGKATKGYTPTVDESSVNIPIYEYENNVVYVSNGIFYVEKENSKNYKKLVDGYAILKKNDKYTLYNCSSNKATAHSSYSNKDLFTIKEYVDKNNLRSASIMEIVDNKESKTNSSANNNSTTSKAQTKSYTYTDNLINDTTQQVTSSELILDFGNSLKTSVKAYNKLDNKTYTVDSNGIITNIANGKVNANLTGEFNIIEIDDYSFLITK